MSSAADDGNDWPSTSSGTTRTPPPRTRRGAPTSRPSFDDLDALDELLDAEQRTPEPASVEPVEPEPAPAKPARGRRTRAAGPKPAPGSSKTFDWDDPDSTAAPDTTVPASDGFGDPMEPDVAFERPAPTGRPARPKAGKRPERRFRQTVQKVDLWSVTKMALCFYVSAMGVVVVSLVALWVVADSAGIIDNVENFIGDLFSSEDFQFISGEVLRGAVLVGVVIVALMVVFTIIAASFYNIFAELFGGVEIVIREEEQPPKR